jgi:hypothetical protein
MSGHGQPARFAAWTTGFPSRNPTLANNAPTPRFAEMGALRSPEFHSEFEKDEWMEALFRR